MWSRSTKTAGTANGVLLLLASYFNTPVFTSPTDPISGQQLLGQSFGVPGVNASYDYVIVGGGTAGKWVFCRSGVCTSMIPLNIDCTSVRLTSINNIKPSTISTDPLLLRSPPRQPPFCLIVQHCCRHRSRHFLRVLQRKYQRHSALCLGRHGHDAR